MDLRTEQSLRRLHCGLRPLTVRAVAIVLLVGLELAGCSATPPSPQMPVGFSIAGNWALVPAESDDLPSAAALRSRGGDLNLAVQDFPVLRARGMTIEQDRDSMGLSFDSGEYRDVSWGFRRRGLWEVQAGWLDQQLVILSKARDANARETFQSGAGGQRLTIRVEIRSGGESLVLTRTFVRI
jgi:hypothetical protein